jgi:hypothetical protein
VRQIRVSSELSISFRDELERIVFFNPEQRLIASPLVESVHRYGVPSIVDDGACLRFRVDAFGLLQTLYVFDETSVPTRLVGVAMFTRESSASMVILHIAVHEDYTLQGKWADVAVVLQLVDAIRGAALRTRGIRTLRALYPLGFDLQVRPNPVVRARAAGGRRQLRPRVGPLPTP